MAFRHSKPVFGSVVAILCCLAVFMLALSTPGAHPARQHLTEFMQSHHGESDHASGHSHDDFDEVDGDVDDRHDADHTHEKPSLWIGSTGSIRVATALDYQFRSDTLQSGLIVLLERPPRSVPLA